MAARWGAGEEMLTACNMEFFSTNTLDETVNSVGLNSGEALEALHSCLDPSILSIFEDAPTGEAKGLDEESEATLLTALTEILDNVDDENLSPFDTLPDSDLLSGQKGREHSPLRRMMCLSRSPPEKDNLRSFSTGKSLPRTQPGSVQRSDGEEEEDGEALTLSPESQCGEQLICWEFAGDLLPLPLPLTLEQETVDGESVSLSLGDLVRHMHPYCMAVCVEGEEEQLLPEGGIFLEVIDQGEHGEPILAIPDMGFPLSFPHLSLPMAVDSLEVEQKVPDDVSCAAVLEMSEPVLVDVTAEEASEEVACPVILTHSSEVKDEKVIIRRPKEEMEEKSPSRRKKKRKNKEVIPPPLEGRILRSGSTRSAAPELPKKPVKEKSEKEKTKKKVMSVPPVTLRHKTRPNMRHTDTHSEITTLTLPTQPSIKVTAHVASTFVPAPKGMTSDLSPVKTTPEKSRLGLLPSGTTAERPSRPTEAPKAPDCDKTQDFAERPAPQAVPQESLALQVTIMPNDVAPLATPQSSEPALEPKPKALNLQQYRLLRQQKKPAPVEKQEDHSTKWPSLPEPPTELPLIPCLPAPGDPRRPNSLPGKKELIEIKPAWQPMGPGAPSTPAALLAPPAYMVASSSKVAGATPALKPVSAPGQQAAALQLAKASQPPVATASGQVMSLPPTSKTHLPKTATAQQILPQTSGSLSASQTVAPAEKSCPVDSRVTSLQSSPTLIPLEALKVVLQQQSTASLAALKECLAVIRASPQPQPSCAKPVVPMETPSKITTNIHKPNTTAAAAASAAVSPLKPTSAALKVPQLAVGAPVSDPAKAIKQTFKPPTPASGPQVSPVLGACSLIPSQCRTERPVGPAAAPVRTAPTRVAPKAKSPTQELIEAFTTEIGIEAADLTSLLEQFEETQAKEEQCVPEVSGKAAAVGNSSVEQPSERTAVERVRGHDLASTAALTPPATPPHQMWKPLAPMALLGKSKAAEGPKPSPSKAIQINARPLPSNKLRSKPTTPAPSVPPTVVFSDHDYCLPQKEPPAGESGKRWNVKQQPAITIKLPTLAASQPTPAASPQTLSPAAGVKTDDDQPPQVQPLDDGTHHALGSSLLETPDASPTRPETEAVPLARSPRQERSYRGYGASASASRTPSPRPSSPQEGKRGRPVKRVKHRSPSSGSSCSDSESYSSQSRSRSPPRKRYRPRHSESSSSGSSSCSSSCSSRSVSLSPPRRRKYSYSSSRSGSWSRSRSRSPRGRSQWRRDSRQHSPSQRPGYRHSSQDNSEEANRRKEKAIEERRVVYVGRIRGTMTRTELRDRFSLYGEIEECTLHFRDHGDNYGFVTYYDTKNAFTAIENGGKLRKPDELPFDLCFGGRRQFCRTSYADLDSNKEYDPSPSMKGKFDALDFDTLLKQAQKNLKR